jgi:hypothetical protein
MTIEKGSELAPEGQIYVCAACGKRARSRFGFDAMGRSTWIDHGWDTSCMTHAVLCYAEKKGGDWIPVEEES